MSKKIIIMRTAPYNYQLEGLNLYQSFNAVAKREIDISVDDSAEEYFRQNVANYIKNFDIVYCSPRKRSAQSAQFITDEPIVLEELVEVRFRMEDFIEEDSFYGEGQKPNVQLARKLFVEALINNNLEESYMQVIGRVESVLKEVTSNSSTVLIFSHGFIMKIIEAYVRDKNIKTNPKKLPQFFDGNSETFKFCEGYVLNCDDGVLRFNSYIRNGNKTI